jgi:hypothetical protein
LILHIRETIPKRRDIYEEIIFVFTACAIDSGAGLLSRKRTIEDGA